MTDRLDTVAVVSSYLAAKRSLVESDYVDEIVWQATRRVVDIDASSFVREAAWVILSSGMRESVVRECFSAITDAFHNWDAAQISSDPSCIGRALRIFRHRPKLEAIEAFATYAASTPIDEIRRQLTADPEIFLRGFPFMGPITWAHLAKNLGLSAAKADRHLERLSRRLQRESVAELCAEVGSWLGEPIEIVDVVLWRWSVLHGQGCSAPRCPGTPHVLTP